MLFVTYIFISPPSDKNIDSITEKFEIQKVSILRRFCKSVGIQILIKDYQLESKNKQVFVESDIISMYPVVKHIHPRVNWASASTLYISNIISLHLSDYIYISPIWHTLAESSTPYTSFPSSSLHHNLITYLPLYLLSAILLQNLQYLSSYPPYPLLSIAISLHLPL